MADENVSSLVTDDILKQAMSTTAVQNALKAQVTMLLCEQIDAAVESVLAPLIGQVVQEADDAAKDDVAEKTDTGNNAGEVAGLQPQSGTGDGKTQAEADDQTGVQASGEAGAKAAVQNAVQPQPADLMQQ